MLPPHPLAVESPPAPLCHFSLPTHRPSLKLSGLNVQSSPSLLATGFLLDFISCPVINGFTSAAAITIGFGQIKVGPVSTWTLPLWLLLPARACSRLLPREGEARGALRGLLCRMAFLRQVLNDDQVSQWVVWGWLLYPGFIASVPGYLMDSPRVLLSCLYLFGRLLVASQLPGSRSHLPDLISVLGFAGVVPLFSFTIF